MPDGRKSVSPELKAKRLAASQASRKRTALNRARTALRMFNEGHSIKDIAEFFGRQPSTISKDLRKLQRAAREQIIKTVDSAGDPIWQVIDNFTGEILGMFRDSERAEAYLTRRQQGDAGFSATALQDAENRMRHETQ